jgi:probable HAF family extracellular repeat protein
MNAGLGVIARRILFACAVTLLAGLAQAAQTGMIDLGVLDPNGFSNALAINSAGEVVGLVGVVGNNPNYRAFVWTKAAGMKDLNHLIPPNTGWYLWSASSINTSGQIVGYGQLHGQYHGFLLTPR